MNRSRFIVTLMAALLAFQSLTWLTAWKGLQVSARREAAVALEQKPELLPKRTFSRAFLQSTQVGGQEISLNGQLFDYKILEACGDSLVVLLYHDAEEESLLDWIYRSIGEDKNDPQQSGALAQWLADWLAVNFLANEPLPFQRPASESVQDAVYGVAILQPQFQPGITCPPPDAARATTLS